MSDEKPRHIAFICSKGDLDMAYPALVMGWAALGSGRRAMFHWHPAYHAGYRSQDPLASFELNEGEMLAACPSCLAVLAIRPTLLGRADRCPHCSAALVSEDVLARYGDEEA